MTNENLKAWIIHFQKRIILSDNPDVFHTMLLNLLTCKYNNVSCITNECEIVQYLNAHLPCLDYTPNTLVQLPSDTLIPISLDPCSFYDLRVDIYIGESTTPSITNLTLIDNPSYFTFSEGFFHFNIKGIVQDFPQAFPNNVYIDVYTKTSVKDLFFTKVISRLLIGYIIN